MKPKHIFTYLSSKYVCLNYEMWAKKINLLEHKIKDMN